MNALTIFRLAAIAAVAQLLLVAAVLLLLYFQRQSRQVAAFTWSSTVNVWAWSISYTCYAAGASLDLLAHLSSPLSYRLPLYGVGFASGLLGLIVTVRSNSQARRER